MKTKKLDKESNFRRFKLELHFLVQSFKDNRNFSMENGEFDSMPLKKKRSLRIEVEVSIPKKIAPNIRYSKKKQGKTQL